MKVLHAIATLDQAAGGPVNALRGLVLAQARAGLDVEVIAGLCPPSSPLFAELSQAGITVNRAIRQSSSAPVDILTCANTLSRSIRSADILHTHGMWSLLPTVAGELARRHAVPYIVRPCGMLDAWSLRQRRWRKLLHLKLVTRRILNGAALIHTTTDQERLEVGPLLASTANIEVVPNGVDDLAFDAVPTVLPEELRLLASHARIVLYFGRIHRKKGLDLLVEAIAKLTCTDVELLVVGPREPDYFREIQAQIRRLKLEPRIRFVDPLYGPERFSVYAAAQLFVLPSQQENFGITVAEAMACGTPVIVSPEVALATTVAEMRTGLVVSRNPNDLAQAIDRLLLDEPQRRSMGLAGRRAAQAIYRWTSIAEKWRQIYCSILDHTVTS